MLRRKVYLIYLLKNLNEEYKSWRFSLQHFCSPCYFPPSGPYTLLSSLSSDTLNPLSTWKLKLSTHTNNRSLHFTYFNSFVSRKSDNFELHSRSTAIIEDHILSAVHWQLVWYIPYVTLRGQSPLSVNCVPARYHGERGANQRGSAKRLRRKRMYISAGERLIRTKCYCQVVLNAILKVSTATATNPMESWEAAMIFNSVLLRLCACAPTKFSYSDVQYWHWLLAAWFYGAIASSIPRHETGAVTLPQQFEGTLFFFLSLSPESPCTDLRHRQCKQTWYTTSGE